MPLRPAVQPEGRSRSSRDDHVDRRCASCPPTRSIKIEPTRMKSCSDFSSFPFSFLFFRRSQPIAHTHHSTLTHSHSHILLRSRHVRCRCRCRHFAAAPRGARLSVPRSAAHGLALPRLQLSHVRAETSQGEGERQRETRGITMHLRYSCERDLQLCPLAAAAAAAARPSGRRAVVGHGAAHAGSGI